jgi:hypothetical protein
MELQIRLQSLIPHGLFCGESLSIEAVTTVAQMIDVVLSELSLLFFFFLELNFIVPRTPTNYAQDTASLYVHTQPVY